MGDFHTVELSHLPRSLLGTSTRSGFLTRYARSWVLPHIQAFSLATLTCGYFRTFEISRSPSAHSWALPHVRAFSLATLAHGYFHTFELCRSPSTHFEGKFLPEIVEPKMFFLFVRKLSKRLKN